MEHASVTAEHERLDRQEKRLDPQDGGMHDPDGVHGVQNQTPGGADGARGDQVVVAGIGVSDTTFPGMTPSRPPS
jgi:hypothetical protein